MKNFCSNLRSCFVRANGVRPCSSRFSMLLTGNSRMPAGDRRSPLHILVFVFFIVGQAFALSPENRLYDAKLEERARQLFLEVRCVTCGGQVIENSDSNFSFEMRQLIREKILSGKSDKQILEELAQEFGRDILVNQGVKSHFGFLLLVLIILVGCASAIIFFKLIHKKS